MDTPDKAIPKELLGEAQGIVIVPGMKQGAFIVGAKYGKGYLSCRKRDGVDWTAPGTIRIEGGSFGFQIGGEETDVILLVMNKSGVDKLLSSQFTLGAGASVAAGPVGRSTKAQRFFHGRDRTAFLRAYLFRVPRSARMSAIIATSMAGPWRTRKSSTNSFKSLPPRNPSSLSWTSIRREKRKARIFLHDLPLEDPLVSCCRYAQ